jgi:triacylglycerol lipase
MGPRSIRPRPEVIERATRFVAVLAASLNALSSAGAQETVNDTSRHELVVLVHGMGRTARSMEPMRRALDSAGFAVLNIGYSSYCCSIPELGAELRRELDARRLPHHTTVHFVGHSLGNILVRWVLTQPERPAGVGRVVMLAPPNQGSRDANRYSGVVGWLLEPMSELRTDSTATVRTIGRVEGVEIGIIAARHDGKVSVEETQLPEAKAHVVLDGTHAFIMRKSEVLAQALAFLRTGQFATVP